MSHFTAGRLFSRLGRALIALLAAVSLIYIAVFLKSSTTTPLTSLRGSDAYTAKASSYDIFRASSPGWNSIQHALQNVPSDLVILDLGCGSGAFLSELAALHPSTLDGIDRNHAMINVALARLDKLSLASPSTSFNIHQGQIDQLQTAKYDIVFCAQVLQNLTPDPSKAAAARIAFMKQINRILKPGGKAIVTTRAISPGADGRYSHLYWYADPDVVPSAVHTMELMVPRDPLAEMTQAGFVNNHILSSNDTVVRFDAYLSPLNLQNPAFRSADSFFQHVKEPELTALLQHVQQLHQTGALERYISDRETLRAGNGHVVTLVGHKQT
jgi:ubiquinone/menaquinone biosynthesis C-methylase UbiE